jgi:hypothetical protein
MDLWTNSRGYYSSKQAWKVSENSASLQRAVYQFSNCIFVVPAIKAQEPSLLMN